MPHSNKVVTEISNTTCLNNTSFLFLKYIHFSTFRTALCHDSHGLHHRYVLSGFLLSWRSLHCCWLCWWRLVCMERTRPRYVHNIDRQSEGRADFFGRLVVSTRGDCGRGQAGPMHYLEVALLCAIWLFACLCVWCDSGDAHVHHLCYICFHVSALVESNLIILPSTVFVSYSIVNH